MELHPPPVPCRPHRTCESFSDVNESNPSMRPVALASRGERGARAALVRRGHFCFRTQLQRFTVATARRMLRRRSAVRYLAAFGLGALQAVAIAQDLPVGGSGVASRYPGDLGIASDPAVIFADDFESYSAVSGLTSTGGGTISIRSRIRGSQLDQGTSSAAPKRWSSRFRSQTARSQTNSRRS